MKLQSISHFIQDYTEVLIIEPCYEINKNLKKIKYSIDPNPNFSIINNYVNPRLYYYASFECHHTSKKENYLLNIH